MSFNTRVEAHAAFVGGVVAGILSEILSSGFSIYTSSASSYQLVYATFATAVLFMIWLYLNWLILLIGASVAFFASTRKWSVPGCAACISALR
ncbi:MAG: YihY/virulence factor BrkB family protein [Proteobacteria bacterium]|nr:YihY/virulence factor BrkB family protein [Pseudomonadota bacterium]